MTSRHSVARPPNVCASRFFFFFFDHILLLFAHISESPIQIPLYIHLHHASIENSLYRCPLIFILFTVQTLIRNSGPLHSRKKPKGGVVHTTQFILLLSDPFGMYATRARKLIKSYKATASAEYNTPVPTLLFTHEHGRHSHPRADTHACHEHLAARLFADVQASRDLACARAAQRVANSDRAAIRVHLLEGNVQVLDGEHGLAGERLVDLVEVDVCLRDACQLERAGDGVRGADTHDAWGDTDRRGGDELADDRKPEALSDRAPREKDGGGAVGYLRGVTCG